MPVFQTPFDESGDINATDLANEIDWLFANGAHGVVFAMVSEVLRMSSEERDSVAALACKLVDGRGPVVISVGAESTHTAVRHARRAEDAGATAVMATPPNLHPVGEDALLEYFTRIAAEVQTPLIVQDASGYVGASLSVEFQMRLHRELGDRVLFKPEAPPVGPRLSRLMAGTSDRARIFEGTGGLYLIDSYHRGAIGSMPAADLVWAVAALWNALTSDDLKRAYRIAGPLAQIVSLQTSLDSYVAIEKHLLVLQGVLTTSLMRDPVGEVLDEHSVQEIERLFGLLRAAVDA